MKVILSEKLKKHFKRLPKHIKIKTNRQFLALSQNLRHPSIRAKKIEGFSDVWEGRIDRFYRFIFTIEKDTITIIRVGPHDEGLGKN